MKTCSICNRDLQTIHYYFLKHVLIQKYCSSCGVIDAKVKNYLCVNNKDKKNNFKKENVNSSNKIVEFNKYEMFILSNEIKYACNLHNINGNRVKYLKKLRKYLKC